MPGLDDRGGGTIIGSTGTAPGDAGIPLPPVQDPMTETAAFRFDNSYGRLPDRFHARLPPAPAPAPRLVRLNRDLAEELGLDPAALSGAEGAALFAGNSLPEGADPLAMAYAGHQFGNFVPRLGDGRAILLGELVDRHGRRRDLQLKGAGRTPFSRGGDGRAALGPVLREYLVSEAMHALGVPTTRALAAVLTGEPVYRERELPGAVLARVAASHVRVGSFEYFAARGDAEGLQTLADHVIARHYPQVADAAEPAMALLAAVAEAQAELVAAWMQVGFIHGVMNTDNMTLSGETIDYGPCAFMDAYDPATVFSSIDHAGRYAFGNQPRIAQWNLARLAEALLPLMEGPPEAAAERAGVEIGAFAERYLRHWHAGMGRKLGLAAAEEGDGELLRDLLAAMQAGHADFTLTFRRLSDAAADPDALAAVRALFAQPAAFDAWAARWQARLAREAGTSPGARAAAMHAVNPAVIPRNHLVEQALAAAVDEADFGPFEALLAVVTRPFEIPPPAAIDYTAPPPPSERVYQTFCGT